MNPTAQHGVPPWPRLVGIQLNLIFRSGRWVELIGGTLALLGLSVLGMAIVGDTHSLSLRNAEWPWLPLVLVLVGAWPALLWRGEPADRPLNDRSLPVPRGPHDLARVAAGGIWVGIVAILVTIIRLLYLQSFTGVFILAYSPGYVAYMLSLVAMYCVSSVPAVVTTHPARWFFGVLVGYVLIVTALGAINPRWASLAGVPLNGRFGFAAATELSVGQVRSVETTCGSSTRSACSSPWPAAAAESEATLDAPTRADSFSVGTATDSLAIEAVSSRDTTSRATRWASGGVIHQRTVTPGTPDAADRVVRQRRITMAPMRPAMAASASWIIGALVALLAISASRHER